MERRTGEDIRRRRRINLGFVVLVACLIVTLGLPDAVLATPTQVPHDLPSHTASRDTCAGMDLTYVTTSANDNVDIPLTQSDNATVDWGDGTTTTTPTAPSHVYANAGTYDVCVTGTVTGYGDGEPSSSCCAEVGITSPGSVYLTSVNSWGNLDPTSLLGAFMGATSLTSVPDTLPASVTDISYMFDGDTSFNQSIDAWNTSNVTLMIAVFNGATTFDQPLNDWNTSSVTDMNNMFSNATSFNQPLNDWNTASVTDMGVMFAGSGFDQDIDDWNVSSLVSMSEMFDENLVFNQPLDDWNVSNVQLLTGAFQNDPVFNQPLNSWNTSNVFQMSDVFYEDTDFNQDLSNWNTSMLGQYGMTLMFDRSGLSPQNYDDFLIGIASRPEMQSVELDARSIYYCSAGLSAHQYLTTTDDWIIVDAGLGTTQCDATTTTTTTLPQGSGTTTTTLPQGSGGTTTTVPQGSATTTTTPQGSTTTTTTSTTSIPTATTTSVPGTQPKKRMSISTMSAVAVPSVRQRGSRVELVARGLPRAATGTVRFLAGSVILCSGTVARGRAECFAPKSLKWVNVKVRAVYGGDSRYLPRTTVFFLRIA